MHVCISLIQIDDAFTSFKRTIINEEISDMRQLIVIKSSSPVNILAAFTDISNEGPP